MPMTAQVARIFWQVYDNMKHFDQKTNLSQLQVVSSTNTSTWKSQKYWETWPQN